MNLNEHKRSRIFDQLRVKRLLNLEPGKSSCKMLATLHFEKLVYSFIEVPSSQGRGSLVGCRLRGRTELDTTEAA